MNDNLNFNLDDLKELKSDEELTKKFLEGSPVRCRIFLWFCKIDGNKKEIKTKDVKDFFRKEISSINLLRLYLNEMVDANLLMKSQLNKKTYKYFLNKNDMYYKSFIPIAKGVLGLK